MNFIAASEWLRLFGFKPDYLEVTNKLPTVWKVHGWLLQGTMPPTKRGFQSLVKLPIFFCVASLYGSWKLPIGPWKIPISSTLESDHPKSDPVEVWCLKCRKHQKSLLRQGDHLKPTVKFFGRSCPRYLSYLAIQLQLKSTIFWRTMANLPPLIDQRCGHTLVTAQTVPESNCVSELMVAEIQFW